MFSPVPSLEALSLPIEVDWQGRKLQVTARLETWPGTSYAVVSCAFEEPGSKYFVRNGKAFYQTGTSTKWVCRYADYDADAGKPLNKIKFSTRGEEKIRSLVQRAFAKNDADWGVVRLIQLPELIDRPRVVAEFRDFPCWCPNPLWLNFVPFRLKPKSVELARDEESARQQILQAWQDESSEVRYAWEWATLTKSERYFKSAGFAGNWDEIEAVMRLILTSAAVLWQLDSGWSWRFMIAAGESHIDSRNGNEQKGLAVLEIWHSVLRSHFTPPLHNKGLENKVCIAKFWKENNHSTKVEIDQPPTAHQQLEAKLALRDWLQSRTTPQQARELLASLDG